MVVQLDVPVSAFMATQKDDMRKPEIGMWEFFVREGNGGKKPGSQLFCARSVVWSGPGVSISVGLCMPVAHARQMSESYVHDVL